MTRKIIAATMILMLGCCFQAYAAVIVDTGPGPSNTNGWSLASHQWLAGEFSLSQANTITDVYGWLSTASWVTPGSATLAIYDDGGEVPGSQLFSAQFSAVPPVGVNSGADWYGASGLNWGLPGGDYWVSFECRANDTYYGGMPNPSSSYLVNEAYTNSGNWTQYDDLNIGVRIYANEGGQGSVVPEPASMILMGIGLAGAALRRKKR